MPVDTVHKDYSAHQGKVRRVRDAIEGKDAIAAAGAEYLPDPDPSDPDRYAHYSKRAVWLGVTRRTFLGMKGAVFRKPPEVDLPTVVDYMDADADGSKRSLEQFSKGLVSRLLSDGKAGVLTDYPEAEDGLTQEETQGLRSTLKEYDAGSIINWRRQGEKLTLVVLLERYEIEIDEFERDTEDQYRVLSLDEDGHYLQRVFREGKVVSESYPSMANGEPFEEIPFQFYGVGENTEDPQDPLLLDIADLNIAHYRNSADWEESSFIVGQPTAHVDTGEMTAEEWQTLNPNGLSWGSRSGVRTRGGSLNLVQADPNTMPGDGMERKEAQMIAIGAKLLESSGGSEREESVRMRMGTEVANLSTVASNVSDGLRQNIAWAAMFMGRPDATTEDVGFELNQEFYPKDADPTMVSAYIQLYDRAMVADSDFWSWARQRGLIDPERTDEEIRSDAANNSGLGLGLDLTRSGGTSPGQGDSGPGDS